MKYGLLGGVFWALDTVILGIALAMTPFVSTAEAIALASFVSTFLHDFTSGCYMLIYTGVKRQFGEVLAALKTSSGKFIILGALLGGPVGMSGYMAAINYIGPAYTAIISAMYPALGTFLSFVFLKEKIKPIQIFGLAMAICGVIALGYTPGGADEVSNLFLGMGCAVMCAVAWASEGVLCTYGMKDPSVTNEHALQIRQVTSAVFYGIVILNVLHAWPYTISVVPTSAMGIVAAAALAGTISYLFYYKALNLIGVSKAMPLNITYSAWSIVFAAILLHQNPDVKSIICCFIILGGSLLAGTDLKELLSHSK